MSRALRSAFVMHDAAGEERPELSDEQVALLVSEFTHGSARAAEIVVLTTGWITGELVSWM